MGQKMSNGRRVPAAVLFAVLCTGPAAAGDQSPAGAGNWPSFRGNHAAGVRDGMNLPTAWDVAGGENIRWVAEIPGLAHSSPVVWRDLIFVTTAVSSRGEADFKEGLYGSGEASNDRTSQSWKILALDKRSGVIRWERTAHEGEPRDKRHIKATYANSTPATDGKRVVAFFGSEGVFAWDMSGKLLWSRSLGRLDAGAYDAPDYEWGTASSPIIDQDRVIVQCDVQGESFIIALDAATGKTLWRTPRDEPPSWGTPTVYDGKRREIIANGSNFIRGYDPATGKELWRLGGSSMITAPTPVIAGDLIVVASGRRPEKPIFVLKPGATGDITLKDGQTKSPWVVWSLQRAGPYMPTPLAYRGILYVLQNQGILDAYDLNSGEALYRQRIEHSGGGFSASPVAADGRLYLPAEDGQVFVVRAGATFHLLGTHDMGERLMATPALSEEMLLVRGTSHLFAVGRGGQQPQEPVKGR
ncbi:MAG: PQQ-binding-like beta-propeller repeat protein [Acidobacteria bacterium]|nr:PQQ-binding-like beta-propeller repeat protein [Acidobacteriota bacterium]